MDYLPKDPAILVSSVNKLLFNRQEFVAQVPTWLQFCPEFIDFVVLASGVVEIAFGLGIIFLVGKWRTIAGALLALFYKTPARQTNCFCLSRW